MIDLMQFAAQGPTRKYNIQYPFLLPDGRVCATDGAMMVAVDPRKYAGPIWHGKGNLPIKESLEYLAIPSVRAVEDRDALTAEGKRCGQCDEKFWCHAGEDSGPCLECECKILDCRFGAYRVQLIRDFPGLRYCIAASQQGQVLLFDFDYGQGALMSLKNEIWEGQE